MRPLRACAVAAALALVAASAPAATGFRKAVGPHFRVLCHFDDDAAAASALETVEATWPAVSDLYGLAAGPVDPPYDVHLYRNAADYLAAERDIAGGKFDRNLAFTSFDTLSAYVCVQPDLTDETLAATGLTEQTRRMLAHEAAHVVRYRLFPNYRSHPGWLGDGAANWIEDETMKARGWSAGPDENPQIAWDMVIAQTLQRGGGLPSARQILRDDVQTLEFYARYAVRRLLFRRLITRKDSAAFRAALTSALRLPEGEDFAKRFFDAAAEPYATEGLDGLDLDFEQYVRSQTPAWDEPYRALSTAGDAWVQTAFADNNAVAWRTAPVGAEAYEVAGQIEILPGLGKTQQMNLLLGRDRDAGFMSVAFVAGYGIDVFRYRRVEDRWEKLASAPTKAVQLWRRLPFRVGVAGGRITVRVDGTEVVSVEAKDQALSGAWGLGVQAGGAAIWRRVRAEPTKPK